MARGFNPRNVWQPSGRGFSMGIVQHDGHVIHFTGQVAWDEHGELVGAGDVRAQTHQCYRNIECVLAEVGGTLVSVTTYFIDLADLPIIQEVRSQYFRARQRP